MMSDVLTTSDVMATSSSHDVRRVDHSDVMATSSECQWCLTADMRNRLHGSHVNYEHTLRKVMILRLTVFERCSLTMFSFLDCHSDIWVYVLDICMHTKHCEPDEVSHPGLRSPPVLQVAEAWSRF